MSTNLKYYYRIDVNGNPVPGSLQRFKEKPVNGKWKELGLTNVCCGSGEYGSVKFSCLTSEYIEFIDGEFVTGVWQNEGTSQTEFTGHIPRGIMSIDIIPNGAGKKLYINGEVVHEFVTNTSIMLNNYDTRTIESMGFGDPTPRLYTTTSNVVTQTEIFTDITFGSFHGGTGTNVGAGERTIDNVRNVLAANSPYPGTFTINEATQTITFSGTFSGCGTPPTMNIMPLAE